MNPRQRQGLMLVVIAAAGLLGVFLLIADYVSSVSKQVGSKISVVTLIAPLNPYQPVTASMLGEVSVPQKWAPRNAITDPAQALEQVSRVPLSAGTELQQGMLTPTPGLSEDQRAMSVPVTAETGAALQIQPGDVVDVLASYQASPQGRAAGARNRAEVVVPSVRVLASGQPSGANGAVSVILAVTPDQSQEVLYAESYATKLILTKVAPNSAPVTPPVYSPSQ
jgi:pilus assembly protein CpaB